MSAATLGQRAYAVWWSQLDRWAVPSSAILSSKLPAGWAMKRLGDVIRQVESPVRVEPEREYKMAGVKWYGEGVFHRETVRGNGLSAKWIMPLVPGALIYNRLFAWKASFAIVPDELADCFVSGEFPQFVTDDSALMAEYLYLYCISEKTIRAVNAASTGSAAVSRNRFREEFFLDFEIPLPPPRVQRAIVAAWEHGRKEAATTRAKIAALEERIEADFLADLGLSKPARATLPKCFAVRWKDLLRWSVMFNQLARVAVDISTGAYPVTTLGDIAAVSYGIQKCPANRPGQHARPYLRVANVQRGELDLREIKYINVPDSEMSSFRLEPGDLLVCEGNSADLVGRPAIWRGEIPDCVHQNHILKVRCDRAKALPEYVLEYMQTPPARNHFRSRAKFTTNLASINSNDLRDTPLPLPPLARQRELSDKLAARRAEIAALRTAAAEREQQAKADVGAMILGTKPVGGD